MSVDYKLIGSRIQRIRKSEKMTQEKLAEMLDVSVGYVSQIERGITKPNLEMLTSICGFLSCDICDLLSGSVRERTAYLEDELLYKCSKLSPEQKSLAIRLIDVITEYKFNI